MKIIYLDRLGFLKLNELKICNAGTVTVQYLTIYMICVCTCPLNSSCVICVYFLQYKAAKRVRFGILKMQSRVRRKT